jgi:hypothetical protein
MFGKMAWSGSYSLTRIRGCNHFLKEFNDNSAIVGARRSLNRTGGERPFS